MDNNIWEKWVQINMIKNQSRLACKYGSKGLYLG